MRVLQYFGWACVLSLVSQEVYAEDGLTLAGQGRSEFSIVLSQQASPSEKHAAAELQHFLSEISGATLPIVQDTAPAAPHEILLGDNAHLRALQLDIDWAALGEEGYVLRTSGGHVILAGGRQRGTLHAVYGFLQDVLGCRWLTPQVSNIPKRDTLEIPGLNETVQPAFEYRSLSWQSASDADWAARNRLNTGAPLDEARGGQITAVGGGHSLHGIIPPDKYFKEHPEYFPEINGQRTAQKTQLCFAQAAVLELICAGVAEGLRANPKAQLAWVAQMDWGGWCQCAVCNAIFEREGSQSGVLLDFVNKVAERIEPEFPGVSIATYGYQDTRKSPKSVRPRKNVIVMVCPIECCYTHPVAGCELNKSFVEDLEGWARLTDKYYLFDYTGNFDHYVMPHPNLHVLQPNFQLYRRQNVRGIFALGNPGAGSELGELRGYLLARLMWNPDLDMEQLQSEFLDVVYGKAAPPLRQYLGLMHDKVASENLHAGISASPMSAYLSPDMMSKADALFAEAETLAEDDAVRERVRVARLPVWHTQLEWLKPKYEVVGEEYKPGDTTAALALAKKFVEVAERNGVTSISEGVPPAWHTERLALWSAPFRNVRLENDALRVDIVPALGGRIISIFQKQAQRELLLEAQADGREYPCSAGYEEYSERGWRSHGSKDEYQFAVTQPGREVQLLALLPNGLKMQRTVTLGESGPTLDIHSQVINISEEEKPAYLRVHPMFQLGPTEQINLCFTTLGGEQRSVKLVAPPGELRGQLFLKGNDLPKGVWESQGGQAGVIVRQSFDNAQIEECLLDWLPNRQRFTLEPATPEKRLAPGGSLHLDCKYEFIRAGNL